MASRILPSKARESSICSPARARWASKPISRGAAACLFVEEEAEARGLIRANVEALALTGITKLFRRDATSLGPAGKMGQFDLVLLDPPYGKGLGEAALTSAIEGGWLAPGAVVVLEERSSTAVTLPTELALLDRRVYGDTQVMISRFCARPTP